MAIRNYAGYSLSFLRTGLAPSSPGRAARGAAAWREGRLTVRKKIKTKIKKNKGADFCFFGFFLF
jgi:hypothetical protein